jgi:APA family basic amino acid/polyamine antiporter
MLMGLIALFFLWTSTFEQILLFAGLVMAANTLVTVMAVFISRARRRRAYSDAQSTFHMPLYPVPAIVFLIITGWTVIYTAVQYPIGLLAAAVLLVTGYPLFKRLRRNS